MNQNNTKYTFIKNQPLGEDLFSNKSQDKIASVISDKIIKEPDFKIIGIDGEWGSGKSNLVKLISFLYMMFGDIKKMNNENQY